RGCGQPVAPGAGAGYAPPPGGRIAGGRVLACSDGRCRVTGDAPHGGRLVPRLAGGWRRGRAGARAPPTRAVPGRAAPGPEGVRPGLRRREAQSRCPELELLAADPARDARALEPGLGAVARVPPRGAGP